MGGVGPAVGLGGGVAKQLAETGASGFKADRDKEKKEMQGLNERLASYIQKMGFMDAKVKELEAENEALKNRKQEDLQPIRDKYEDELDQARKVIDDLSSKQGVAEAKAAGLQDEIDRLNDLIKTMEQHARDDQKKLANLDSTVGELEGELSTVRARADRAEEDAEKQRELVKKLKDQLRGLREDLDHETCAHIEAECLAQTKTEEVIFLKDLLDQIELIKPEPVQIKGVDAAEYWQQNMKKALREIQASADEKVEMIQADCDARIQSQMNSVRSGAIKDNMQLKSAKDEVTRLREQLAKKNTDYSAMANKIALLQSERNDMASRVGELETELDAQRMAYESRIAGLDAELEAVVAQLKTIMDAKLSMELEIACYKKLLEGEETRSTTPVVSMEGLRKSGGGLGALLKTAQSSGKMTVQRTAKGAVGFASLDHAGGNVCIDNDKKHAQAKDVNLKGWKLLKYVDGKTTQDVVLKDFNMSPGTKFTLWAKGAKETATEDNEMVADSFSFGVGTCVWRLFDTEGEEKASLSATFTT